LPLHRDIPEACDLIRQDVLAVANNPQKKQQVRVKPDRPAPARFFKPEGAGHILEPAEIEQNFKDLLYRPDQLVPYQASQTEEELIDRVRTLRSILCIRRAHKWIDEAVMNTVRALELQLGWRTRRTEDRGRSLHEMLTIVERLSVPELDRVWTDFVNTLIARRNLWA